MTVPVTAVFHDLPKLLAEHEVEPRGVIHVGAHHGQEVPHYAACGFGRVMLIEPNPECIEELVKWPGPVEVLNCAVGLDVGTTTLYVTEFDQQSSTRRPKALPVARKIEGIPILRLDQIDQRDCNVLVIDAQGCELDVLASDSLDGFEMIVVETCTMSRYAGQPTSDEVRRFLEEDGDWRKAAAYKHPQGPHIADLVFVRR